MTAEEKSCCCESGVAIARGGEEAPVLRKSVLEECKSLSRKEKAERVIGGAWEVCGGRVSER